MIGRRLPPTLLPESVRAAKASGKDEAIAIIETRTPPVEVKGFSPVDEVALDVIEVQTVDRSPSLSDMKVKDLRAIAEERGISLKGVAIKKEIVRRLEQEAVQRG